MICSLTEKRCTGGGICSIQIKPPGEDFFETGQCKPDLFIGIPLCELCHFIRFFRGELQGFCKVEAF